MLLFPERFHENKMATLNENAACVFAAIVTELYDDTDVLFLYCKQTQASYTVMKRQSQLK